MNLLTARQSKIKHILPSVLHQSSSTRKLFSSGGGSSEHNASAGRRYSGGSIVISGISGRFPKSSNVKELRDNLFAGKELTSESSTRWRNDRLPKRLGFLPQLDKFDARFFNLTPAQASVMDPQTRILLEVVFEAFIDAGLNPVKDMRGSRTAVFCGTYGEEGRDYKLLHPNPDLIGHRQVMFSSFLTPGRITFFFDLQGPSSQVCTACSSSFTALEAAVQSIESGKCDAAVVTASTLQLNPQATLELMESGVLAPDGRCKAFDEAGDGFVRSEAVVAIILQKASDARRSYARILTVGSNTDGFKHQGFSCPSSAMQEKLLRETYDSIGIQPGAISYIEGHGTGTALGDPEELEAISRVFCQTSSPARDQPLLLGSVKSNMGHSEAAAGLCSLAKTIISIQEGVVPPNLHFHKLKLRPETAAQAAGTLQVVTQPTAFDRGLIGVTSLGMGGTNYHCVLEPGSIRPVGTPALGHDLPVLLPLAGRTQEKTEASLKEAISNAKIPEFAYLLRTAYGSRIPGLDYRGYALVNPKTAEVTTRVEAVDSDSRQIWAIFPGLGCQWNEMGKDLMRIPPFADSLNRSKVILKNLGVDLADLLRPGNAAIFEDIRHSLVATTAVQIALYDTLAASGLYPDGLIGHSQGECLCAYADGCLSAEEALRLTDSRGRAFKETRKVIGGMASIGLSAEEAISRLPPGIELACNNTADNVTVAGEMGKVREFVEQLKAEGKFAVLVNSSGLAAHSSHIEEAAVLLTKYATEIIKGDRPRSKRWVSTSIPEKEWDSPLAKFASPEYFGNNVRATVRFYEALKRVPPKALVVEVSPKRFLQALLKSSVPKDCVHVAPMSSKAEDGLEHFFQSGGEIYLAGVDVQIEKLYPAVATPVAANVPFLSPLVSWDHESSAWETNIIGYPLDPGSEVILDLRSPQYAPIAGHKIEDRVLFPATGYLHLAWMQWCENSGRRFEDTPVVFTNLVIQRAIILTQDGPTKLSSTLLSGTGAFEFRNGGDVVVAGNVTEFTGKLPAVAPNNNSQDSSALSTERLHLTKDDVYKELRLRGYNYGGAFKGIQKISIEGNWAEVEWTGNWISFLDTLLQTFVLSTSSRNHVLPVDIERVVIHPTQFLNHLKEQKAKKQAVVRVNIYHSQNKLRCPGIEMRGCTTRVVPRKGQRGSLAFEQYTFCPLISNDPAKLEPAMWEIVDLLCENNPIHQRLQVFDVFHNKEHSISDIYRRILSWKPLYQSNVTMLTLESEAESMGREKEDSEIITKKLSEHLVPPEGADLVFLDSVSQLAAVSESLKPSGFLLLHSVDAAAAAQSSKPALTIRVISRKKRNDGTEMLLLRKLNSNNARRILHVPIVDSSNFEWLSVLQDAVKKSEEEVSRVYITSQANPHCGLLGLFKCLRVEDGSKDRLRCIFDPEQTLKLDFSQPCEALKTIIDQDLVMNVVRTGILGTYRHIPLPEGGVNFVTRPSEHAYLSTLTPGDLTSLRWIQSPLELTARGQSHEGSLNAPKLYNVAYAAMNFRDVLLATGTIPIEPTSSYKAPYLGFEFSGYDPTTGERVMGFSKEGALATSVIADPRVVWSVPEHWSLEEAATVPIVYATVLYALHQRGRVQPGQTVLIHAGAGGVGQAAISVALSLGCKVLTTVGTPEKRALIKKLFPVIADDQIGNSRDTSFEDQFMQYTNGRGVDIVLNSLADDKLMASVRCLAQSGKFLEIGVYDAFKNTPLGMRAFLKNIDFQGVELYHIFNEGEARIQELRQLMLDGIASGAVRPLPTHVFEATQAEEAFRFMAGGKHSGKLLIKVRDEAKDALDKPLSLPAIGRTYFPADKSYVIVGGLGGLGLEVANWMVERGARHLILITRSGVTSGYQELCLRKWRAVGVTAETPVIGLSDKTAAENFIKDLTGRCELGGIFNSAMVLRDDTFTNQSAKAFEDVSAPKARVTRYLDELTRQYCPNLNYFVVFSSSACGKGNSGQTNYGWANSVMERICENRVADGLHGLAIQWGVIDDVGYVAEKMPQLIDSLEVVHGARPQSIDSCLEVLDTALLLRSPVVSSVVLAERRAGTRGEKEGLLEKLQNVFGIQLASVSPERRLTEVGMDSLIRVELQHMLERDYELPMTRELLLSLTVADLKAIDSGTFSSGRRGATGEETQGKSAIRPFVLHDKPLVKLESAGSSPGFSLFIVHGFNGSAETLAPLASKLSCEVYGFQFGEHTDDISVPAVAATYIQALKVVQPKGPYAIAGYSFGGSIAYEMALQLKEKHNNEVRPLIFLDGCPTWTARTEARGMQDSPKIPFAFLTILLKLAPPERRKEFESKFFLDGNLDLDVIRVAAEAVGLEVDQRQVECYASLGRAIEEYEPQGKYSGEAILIQASERSLDDVFVNNFENSYFAKYCTGKLEQFVVQGDHEGFLQSDKVRETAEILNKFLGCRGASGK